MTALPLSGFPQGSGPGPGHTSAAEAAQLHARAQAWVHARPAAPADRWSADVSDVVRCLDLNGVYYCLGQGFRDAPLTLGDLGRLGHHMPSAPASQSTGDMSLRDLVVQRRALGPREREAAEMAELDVAIEGVAAARTISAEVAADEGLVPQGPAPEPLPDSRFIMSGYQTRQERSNWCGPATFQSVDWADDQQKDSQASWATDLGTTSSGTSISAMVSLTNSKTNWDQAAAYVVQSVASWSSGGFLGQHQRKVGSLGRPVIEHPLLRKAYFAYLAGDHSGHFQVGRGYDMSAATIGIFEPFNEPDFNASYTRNTWGAHNVSVYKMLEATKANSAFQNIGL